MPATFGTYNVHISGRSNLFDRLGWRWRLLFDRGTPVCRSEPAEHPWEQWTRCVQPFYLGPRSLLSHAVLTEQVAGGIIVPGSGRLVECLGVDDLVNVDMPDTLMVTTRARSQEVKRLVKKANYTNANLSRVLSFDFQGDEGQVLCVNITAAAAWS